MSGMSQCHFQSGELSEAENASSIIERVDSVNNQQVLDLPYTFTTSPAGGLLDSDCRCIIIWLTAARLRDSDCHCISCSFLQHSFVSLFPITVQFSRRKMHDAHALLSVLCDCVERERDEIGRYLHLGKLHCDSLQPLAWS